MFTKKVIFISVTFAGDSIRLSKFKSDLKFRIGWVTLYFEYLGSNQVYNTLIRFKKTFIQYFNRQYWCIFKSGLLQHYWVQIWTWLNPFNQHSVRFYSFWFKFASKLLVSKNEIVIWSHRPKLYMLKYLN